MNAFLKRKQWIIVCLFIQLICIVDQFSAVILRRLSPSVVGTILVSFLDASSQQGASRPLHTKGPAAHSGLAQVPKQMLYE
jgi:hypothetical protein